MKYKNIKIKDQQLLDGIEVIVTNAIEKFNQHTTDQTVKDQYVNSFELIQGRKYLRIKNRDKVFGYIAIQDDGDIIRGDMLKSNGHYPALNRARGNVLNQNDRSVEWEGIK